MKIEHPLPEGYEEFQDDTYQTKDLDPSMTLYRITAEGKLAMDVGKRKWVDGPGLMTRDGEEILRGHLERVTDEWKDVEYHGDLCIYTSRSIGEKTIYSETRTWTARNHIAFELKARFTEGVLSRFIIEQDDFAGYLTPLPDDPFERERIERFPGISFKGMYYYTPYRVPWLTESGWTIVEALTREDREGLTESDVALAHQYYETYAEEVDELIAREERQRREMEERLAKLRKGSE